MDTITLGLAYSVSENVKAATVPQLFWSLDRFDYDRKGLDEGAREQRSAAVMLIALELDARNVRLRDPTVAVEWPRVFPGVRAWEPNS